MENITLGQIAAGLALIVGLIASVVYLKTKIEEALEKLLNEKFKALNSRIDTIEGKIDKVDMETCKNFLVRFLADVENGSVILPQESQRFWEEYEHYTDNKGNSYIKEWVAKLKKKGLL